MKKILSILAVVCFVAVNVSFAQDAPKADAKETKTETVKTDAKAKPGCCRSSSKSCSKEAAKNCGPNEKAETAKSTDKAKAEEAKKETKSGTN